MAGVQWLHGGRPAAGGLLAGCWMAGAELAAGWLAGLSDVHDAPHTDDVAPIAYMQLSLFIGLLLSYPLSTRCWMLGEGPDL